MNKNYERLKLLLSSFQEEDVITTSPNGQSDFFDDAESKGWEGEEW